MPNISKNKTPTIKVERRFNPNVEYYIAECSKGIDAINIGLTSLELKGDFKVFCYNLFSLACNSTYSSLISINNKKLELYGIHYKENIAIVQLNTTDYMYSNNNDAEDISQITLEISIIKRCITNQQEQLNIIQENINSIIKGQTQFTFEWVKDKKVVYLISVIFTVLLTFLGYQNPPDIPPTFEESINNYLPYETPILSLFFSINKL